METLNSTLLFGGVFSNELKLTKKTKIQTCLNPSE